MNIFERQNGILGMEFDRYMREHPDFGENFQKNSHIVLLKQGDDKFNEWSTNMGKKQKEVNQEIVYVTIKKLAPIHSRIEELELTSA